MFTVTFYSFKGGVGRTFALMNVAVDLVKQGKNVTVLDFDLEAPGLNSFKELSKCNKKGIQDYVSEYINSNGEIIPEIDEFIYKSQHKSITNIHSDGDLWFVPASKNGAYEDISWKNLYKKFNGFLLLEEMKLQIKKHTKSDYLLIDSRTGFTDHSSICTKQMPDLITAMFFPNNQNIDGLHHVINLAKKTAKINDKKLPILYVASRLPTGDDESGVLNEKLVYAYEKLINKEDTYFKDFLKIHHNSKTELLDQLILTNYETKGSIQLKEDYENLSMYIEYHNELSERGNYIFLHFLLSGNSPINTGYELNSFNKSKQAVQQRNLTSSADDLSLFFNDLILTEEQKIRLDKIPILFWDDTYMNEMSAKVCSRISNNIKYKLRFFWFSQLNFRLNFNNTKLVDETDLFKILQSFMRLNIDNYTRADIIKTEENLLLLSFDKSISEDLLASIGNNLDSYSMKKLLIDASNNFIFSKNKSSFSETRYVNLISNALFILIALDYQNFVKDTFYKIANLITEKNVLRNVIRRFDIKNNFYTSLIEENMYPFDFIHALEQVYEESNVWHSWKYIINSDSDATREEFKKFISPISKNSYLFLFERGLYNYLNLPRSKFLTIFLPWVNFINNFNQSIILSHKYFDDISIRLNYSLKAFIIFKIFNLDQALSDDLFEMDAFHVDIKTIHYEEHGFEYEEENNLGPDEGNNINYPQTKPYSYFEYLNQNINLIDDFDTENLNLKNPFSNALISLDNFIELINAIKSIEKIDDLIYFVKK